MGRYIWIKARRKIEDEGGCRSCGCSALGNKIDAAHVIPLGKSKRKKGSEVGPEEVIPLCRDCHTRYDSGLLDLWRGSLEESLLSAPEFASAVEWVERGNAKSSPRMDFEAHAIHLISGYAKE